MTENPSLGLRLGNDDHPGKGETTTAVASVLRALVTEVAQGSNAALDLISIGIVLGLQGYGHVGLGFERSRLYNNGSRRGL
jgi:hypothetical protein